MSQAAKGRLATANVAQPKVSPHRARAAVPCNKKCCLLKEDWRISPGNTAFIRKNHTEPGSICSWRTEALLIQTVLSIANCLSFTKQACVCGVPVQHPSPRNPAHPHRLRDTTSEKTAVTLLCSWGTEAYRAHGSTHFKPWHLQKSRDSCNHMIKKHFLPDHEKGAHLSMGWIASSSAGWNLVICTALATFAQAPMRSQQINPGLLNTSILAIRPSSSSSSAPTCRNEHPQPAQEGLSTCMGLCLFYTSTSHLQVTAEFT